MKKAVAATGEGVAVLAPMIWSLRNVVTSGLAASLAEAGARVELLLPSDNGWSDYPHKQGVAGAHRLLTLAPRHTARGGTLLSNVAGSAFKHRFRLHRQRMAFDESQQGEHKGQSLRFGFVELGGSLCRFGPLERALSWANERMHRWQYDLSPIRRQLEQLQPRLVLSTVCVAPTEWDYLRVARSMGIPTLAAVLSFDNLTSRNKISVSDYWVVWNQRMRETLLKLYPQVPGAHVHITGTPQFDFHRRPEFFWSEAETHRRVGLPDRARYLLYAANVSRWTPTEPELITALAKRLRETADLKDVWLVVRLHPLDEPARWLGLASRASQVLLCSPWISGRDADGWSWVGPDDQRLLVNSLRYSIACINMCSTTALDAAVLDRPVIGIAFASVIKSKETEVYREAYRSHHYRPLVESGGLRLARDWGELFALIRRAIKCPEEDRLARRLMIDQECGLVDGRAAERITKVILGLLKR